MKPKRIDPKWTPFVPVTPNRDVKAKAENATVEYFQNSRYFVSRDQFFRDATKSTLAFAVLSVRRLDRRAEFPWRDLQLIKNELLGRDLDAVELYPAESRLVDTANQRYIWFLPTLPSFGFATRELTEESIAGSNNAPFREEHRPPDLMDSAALAGVEQRVLVPEDFAEIMTRVVNTVADYLDRIPGVPKTGSVVDRLRTLVPSQNGDATATDDGGEVVAFASAKKG